MAHSYPRFISGVSGIGPRAVILVLMGFYLFTIPVCARKVLMVGGNFSVNGRPSNLAFYDLSLGRWTNSDGKSVYLYGQSNGALLDIAVDRASEDPDSDDSTIGWVGDTAYAVGTFDADSLNSQTALCSVAQWSGRGFAKVGEGLCPRGVESSSVTSVRRVVLDDQDNIYVGGSFHARVWNGPAMSFVDVFDLAHYSVEAGWLPLAGNSRLMCLQAPNCEAGVHALAWDDVAGILYVGGVFDSLNNAPFSTGLAQWRRNSSISGTPNIDSSNGAYGGFGADAGASGLEVFPGGGASVLPGSTEHSEVVALAFDQVTESLFVSGRFDQVGDSACTNIAAWHRASGTWLCLHDTARSFSRITTMMLDLDLNYLYLAGYVSDQSDWTRSMRNSIARLPLALVDAQHDSISMKDRDRNVVYEKGKGQRRLRTRTARGGGNASEPPRTLGGDAFVVRGTRIYQRRVLANRRAPVYPPSSAPTPSPTKPVIRWEWLPGFVGAPGSIFALCMLPGTGALFIGGSFNGLSSVLVWFGSNASAIPLSFNKNIFGFVSSLAVANILETSPVPSSGPSNSKPISAAHRLGAGIIGGLLFVVAVGGAFAMGFNTKIEYNQITSSPGRSAQDDDDDEEDEGYVTGEMGSGITSISLDTLSGGARSSIDIHECLENAMRQRRVRFHETLSIIDSSEIALTGIIGEGSYGRVWAARWRNNTVAVKEFVFAQAALMGGSLQTRELIEEIVGEAGIMSLLNHPKILQLYGVSLTTQTIWIVSELCTLGSLRSLLSNRAFPLEFKAKLSLCMDIADGMRYLHSRRPPIIHRDLKSQNIFIVDAGAGRLVAKIGDWGSARAIELSGGGFQHMTQGIGTTCWLAPEVIENAHASLASDVYAFGIVLWEIFTRNEVYEGLTAAQIIARVVKSGLRPVAPPDCPLSGLMQQCWAQDPSERPSFKSILKTLSTEYESISRERS